MALPANCAREKIKGLLTFTATPPSEGFLCLFLYKKKTNPQLSGCPIRALQMPQRGDLGVRWAHSSGALRRRLLTAPGMFTQHQERGKKPPLFPSKEEKDQAATFLYFKTMNHKTWQEDSS